MTNDDRSHSIEPLRVLLASLIALVAVSCSGCGDADIAKLTAQLKDDDSGVRKSAAKDLENIGPRAAPAVQALAICLSDEEPKVRYRAAKALSKIGRASKGAITQLAGALITESDAETRYYIVKSLDQFGDEAGPVLKELTEALSDESPKVRYYSVKILGKIGVAAESSVTALRKLEKDEDAAVRQAVDSALRRIDKK